LMIGGASFVGHGTQRSAVDESALAVDKEADAVLDSLPHADVRSAPRSTLLTGIRLAHTVNTDGKSASRVSAPQSSSSARAVTVPDDTDQSLADDRLRIVRAMTDIFRARPARVPIQEQTLAPAVIASVKAKKGKFAAHAERKWSSGARKVEAMVLAKGIDLMLETCDEDSAPVEYFVRAYLSLFMNDKHGSRAAARVLLGEDEEDVLPRTLMVQLKREIAANGVLDRNFSAALDRRPIRDQQQSLDSLLDDDDVSVLDSVPASTVERSLSAVIVLLTHCVTRKR